MAISMSILERELSALPVNERIRLADLLLASLAAPKSDAHQAAVVAECQDRLQAYEQGEIEALDGDEVMDSLTRRFTR